ncbi:MAG TPA: response regulator [Opitutaceae bacterium]|nr:response regulator [Opitutaceae bacterium]
MKILLVEDHPAVAEVSCNLLREVYGHEVVHVATGKAALEALAGFCPDMVLLDVHLPDMTGYDVAVRLRAEPKWESVILVALTGFGNEVDCARATAVGIDAHFRKPMDFELLSRLKRAA